MQDYNTYAIPDPEPRYCETCRRRLANLNPETMCFCCQEKVREEHLRLMTSSGYTKHGIPVCGRMTKVSLSL